MVKNQEVLLQISPRIQWITKNIKGQKILDIGFAGETEPVAYTEIRHALPQATIIGVDIQAEMVYKHKLSDTAVGDGTMLPFEEASFDTVTLFEVIEHLDTQVFEIFCEARRVLRTGGMFLLTTPNPYSWSRWFKNWALSGNPTQKANYKNFLGSPDHKMVWEPLSLINLLALRGLTVTSITTKNHRIPVLSRWIKRLKVVDLPFFPFSRLGGYTCIIALATEHI